MSEHTICSGVLRHMTTTHAVYKTTVPFTQRIKICIAVEYILAKSVLLKKAMFTFPTTTRGYPGRAHQSLSI